MAKIDREALKKTVLEIYSNVEAVNIAECCKKTAAELNKRRIKTVQGKSWTWRNVDALVRREGFHRDFGTRPGTGQRKKGGVTEDQLKAKVLSLYQTVTASNKLQCYQKVRDTLNDEGTLNYEGEPWRVRGVKGIVEPSGIVRDFTSQLTGAPSEPTTDSLLQPVNEQQATQEGTVPADIAAPQAIEKQEAPEQAAGATSGQNVLKLEAAGGPALSLDAEIEALTSTSAVNREAAIGWLTEQLASGRLEKVIEWAERMIAETEGIQKSLLSRPKFKRDKPFSTGIVISDTVLEAARAKQAGEGHRVGTSLSALIQWLLWQYTGAPEDLIEGGAGGRD